MFYCYRRPRCCGVVAAHCSVCGKKELRKQDPARPSWESEGIRTKCLECPSNVKIKQGLLATAARVVTLLVQTKVWVKPSPRLKPDTIGGAAESQKAKGISCNRLLSCFTSCGETKCSGLSATFHGPFHGEGTHLGSIEGLPGLFTGSANMSWVRKKQNCAIIFNFFAHKGSSYNHPYNVPSFKTGTEMVLPKTQPF